eukprot:3853128-Prymnesium_polylepis.1
MSTSSCSARCHCCPLPHAEIAALKLTTSGGTPASRISLSSNCARSHWPALSHTEMRTLKLTLATRTQTSSGCTPRAII